jgi:indolepyruvate ferredoxin oxidoreductase beta subunit
VEPSLTAFAAGFQAAGQPPAPTPQEQPVKLGPRLQQLAARIESDFPPASHAILLAGFQRLADYQDVRYADEYLNRLEAIRTLDRDCGLLNEAARHLALWMSYEDTIRVADLKTRRTRFERVHREVRGNASQVIQIREFLHPRVEEISDTLPAGLGRWLLRTAWARKLVERFTKNGMVVQTTSLSGFMMLYGVAGLRRFRRKSLRFTIEQQRIGEWLAQVERLARNNYALAVEIAECPQLLKGYGDTHHRGLRNFETIMAAVSTLEREQNGAASLKRLREAALADENGETLAKALREVSA